MQLVPSVASTQTDPSVNITESANKIISMPPKARAHAYLTLTPVEIKKLSSEEPNNRATGTVTEIMRLHKTGKLVFQYWNHTVHNTTPKEQLIKSSSTYIVCHQIIHIAYTQHISQVAKTRKKARQRKRPRVEWYHKLHLHTGEQRDREQHELALEHPDWITPPQQSHTLFSGLYTFAIMQAFTAINMNDVENQLTSTDTLKGPELD